MIVVAAIDLIGGRCVRLAQGDFARETLYSDDPEAALEAFAEAGATEVHLVDLDGARARAPRQHDLFAALAALRARHPLLLQVAGGFRDAAQVRRMIDAGVGRVVIGSLAVDEPARFAAMIEEFGADRLTLALDVRIEGGTPWVQTHGWATGSGETLTTMLRRFPALRHLLVTDIARDGMLDGPNLALMRDIAGEFPEIQLQASGGVCSLDDLDALRAAGAARAIVGKAIWEKRFDLAKAVARARC